MRDIVIWNGASERNEVCIHKFKSTHNFSNIQDISAIKQNHTYAN